MTSMPLAALLAALLVAPAADAEDLLKTPGEGAPPALPEESLEPLQSAPVIQAEGRIERIDRDRGTLSIAHDAVPALGWAAGSRRFHVIAEQLDGLRAGDEVRFTFQGQGDAAAIVGIEPRR